MLAALLVAACLTPTDGDSRFGEARVQPEFAAGSAPDDLGIVVDSIRTVMRRSGSTTVAVDTVLPYHDGGDHAWIIELHSVADVMDVTIELRVGQEIAYQGTRSITVSEGTAGRAPPEQVPVTYNEGAPIAVRIDVVPADAVFNVLGTSRRFAAVVYDVTGAVLVGKVVRWAVLDPGVATVDADGLVTATGQGTTGITATADGVTGTATIRVDTMLVRSTTIEADSVALNADGAARTVVTVSVLDVSGTPIGLSAGTVTLRTTLGTLSAVIDRGDGTYTAVLTAGTTAGDAVITGALNGAAILDSAIVTLRPPPPDPARTTLTADSASIAGDGISATRLTVQVRNRNGNPIGRSAGTVVLNTTHGMLSAVTDHGDGTYTATLRAGTPIGNAGRPGSSIALVTSTATSNDTAIVTGTLNEMPIAAVARIEFRNDIASTPIAARIDVVPADAVFNVLGTSRRFDAVVYDVTGAVLVGKTVSWAALNPGVAKVDADGSVTATGQGRTGITATADGVTGTATIRVDTTLARSTTIEADSAALNADGASRTVVTVSVLDVSGTPIGLSAGTVTLRTTLGTLSAVIDRGDGTYTAVLTASTTAGDAVITGSLNGAAILDSAIVTLRPLSPDPVMTTLIADSASIAGDGISATRVMVQVRDRNGDPIGHSAGTVVLTTTHGILSAVTDRGDGTYTATLRAGTPIGNTGGTGSNIALPAATSDTAIVTGTLNEMPIAAVARIEIRNNESYARTTIIEADSTSLTGVGARTKVTVTVRDAAGNRVNASVGVVVLYATRGIISPVTDHQDGTYTADLIANGQLGTVLIGGTLNGVIIADWAELKLR